MSATEEVIEAIIEREGGWVNNASDHGGCTKYGVTVTSLSKYRGFTVTCADVYELTTEEAKDLYLKEYVEEPHFDAIEDDSLRALMVDSGVLHGQGTATEWLQQALGIQVDGQFGPHTITALKAVKPMPMYAAVLEHRIHYMASIVAHDASQVHFLRGWMNRATSFLNPWPYPAA